MTLQLIKRFVWGNSEQKELNGDELIEVDVNVVLMECDNNEAVCEGENDGGDKEGEGEGEGEGDGEGEGEGEGDGEDEAECESEENEDQEIRECNFQYDFNSELCKIFTSPQFRVVFNLYAGLVILSISATTYNWFTSDIMYTSIPALPFCEKTFTSNTHILQRASAIAHLPYVPALFLGISYESPEILHITSSKETRLFLWVQFAMQLFTSFGDHIMANSLSRDISTALSLMLLYNFYNITTPTQSIDARSASVVIAISVAGYLASGTIPIIVIGFTMAILLEAIIPNSFGLLTPDARLMLLYPFVACAVTLLVETIGLSSTYPWHVVYDIIFWQVLGSTVDVVILSPRPGRFIMAE